MIQWNVLVILLLDIWPEYGRGWGAQTAPTGTRGRGLGSEILSSALAGRVLESKHGSVVGLVLFGLFEYSRLIGLDVAFVVSAFRHGI